MHQTAFPPHRTTATSRVSNSEALTRISEYLQKAEHDASLHPNALVTEAGPTLPYGRDSSGLTLHNLKRFEAGLRGEYLAADVDLDKVAEGVADLPREADVTAGKTEANDGEMQFEWQNMSEIEQEQDETEGEIRSTITGLGMLAEGEEPEVVEFQNTSANRAAKKKAKKSRFKERRRENEEQKAREKRLANGTSS